jgi:hypothetical protein
LAESVRPVERRLRDAPAADVASLRSELLEAIEKRYLA